MKKRLKTPWHLNNSGDNLQVQTQQQKCFTQKPESHCVTIIPYSIKCYSPHRLTTEGVSPLLQVGVALHPAVSWSNVLGGAGDGCFGHDRVRFR